MTTLGSDESPILKSALSHGNSITYAEYAMMVPQRVARLAPQYEYRRDQVSAVPRPIHKVPPPVPGVASEYNLGSPYGYQEDYPHMLRGEYLRSR